MKRYVLIILVATLFVYFTGCAKKKKEEEFLSMDELGALNLQNQATIEIKPEVQTSIPAPVVMEETRLEPVPVSAPTPSTYKPTTKEIQTALKNAGYYAGEVDGKIGRLTQKAIEDFQGANGLEADGKVGSKTWAALGKYLNVQPAVVSTP